jgi:hypothetical protein
LFETPPKTVENNNSLSFTMPSSVMVTKFCQVVLLNDMTAFREVRKE